MPQINIWNSIFFLVVWFVFVSFCVLQLLNKKITEFPETRLKVRIKNKRGKKLKNDLKNGDGSQRGGKKTVQENSPVEETAEAQMKAVCGRLSGGMGEHKPSTVTPEGQCSQFY